MSVARNGLIASVEGISGSGKSYLLKQLLGRLKGSPFVLVPEASDRSGATLDASIIKALTGQGDRFFRLGTPVAETFLLLALKCYDYEAMILPALRAGQKVIEDRSVDTIAVYQAILLGLPARDRASVASDIISLAAQWRPLPEPVFLLVDDFATSIARAERRMRKRFSTEDIELLQAANALYDEHASRHSRRFVLLDRRSLPPEGIVEAMEATLKAEPSR